MNFKTVYPTIFPGISKLQAQRISNVSNNKERKLKQAWFTSWLSLGSIFKAWAQQKTWKVVPIRRLSKDWKFSFFKLLKNSNFKFLIFTITQYLLQHWVLGERHSWTIPSSQLYRESWNGCRSSPMRPRWSARSI